MFITNSIYEKITRYLYDVGCFFLKRFSFQIRINYLLNICLLALLFILFNYKILNSKNLIILAPIDSNLVNSNTLDSSLSDEVVLDSTKKTILFEPIQKHGSLLILDSNQYQSISKYDILWIEYIGLNNIIEEKLSCYPLYLGDYYQYSSFSAFGSDNRNINFKFNNRPINDAHFESYNINMFPTEFFEQIQIFTGSDAVIFSGNSSGALINIQEIKYQTARPYSKLRVEQSAGSFISSDGIYSQNIMPNTNMTFGFRKTSSSGNYSNQWSDSWNIRGILRWNASDKFNISFVESFHNYSMATNGGLDLSTSNLFDPRESQALYNSFNERVYRHDISITTTYLPDSLNSSLSITAFLTFADWYRKLPDEFSDIDSSLYFFNYLSNQYGLTGSYENKLTDFLTLKIGGEFNYSLSEKNIFSDELKGQYSAVYGYLILKPITTLQFSGGIRTANRKNKFINSVGSRLTYFADNLNLLYADMSFSQRLPSASEGLNLKNENHFLFLAGFKQNKNDNTFHLDYWYRSVLNPINSIPLLTNGGFLYDSQAIQYDNFTSTGLAILYHSKIITSTLHLLFRGNISFDNWDDSPSFANPRFYASSSIEYHIKKVRSEARLGLKIAGSLQQTGFSYLPQRRQFIHESSDVFSSDGLSIYAKARFGSAYINLSFNNILGTDYYYVKYYPALGRHFSFSVNWAFFD